MDRQIDEPTGRWMDGGRQTDRCCYAMSGNEHFSRFKTAYNEDKAFKYPHMMWDLLPKASASQPHPHVQVTLAPAHHYGMS